MDRTISWIGIHSIGVWRKAIKYIFHDLGTDNSTVSVNYPDYAHKLCKKVACNSKNIGILVCGSGMGMSMVDADMVKLFINNSDNLSSNLVVASMDSLFLIIQET